MKTFEDINVQNLFPQMIYNRGLSYYKDDRVHDLSYDRNNDVWTAAVQGTDSYFVEIDMSRFQEGAIHTYCDCPAFSSYQSCKHIAAAMLAIADHPIAREQGLLGYEYQMTDRLMDLMAENATDESAFEILQQKAKMHVEFHVKWSYDKTLFIELKTGVKRCYIVKDIRDFLEHVMEKREFYFTKAFTYSPEAHYFDDEDFALLKQLYTIIQNEEIYKEDIFLTFHKSGKQERSLLIPPVMAREILEEVSARDVYLEDRNTTYRDIRVVTDELPFEYSLKRNDREDLLLEMHHIADSIYFEPYDMLLKDGVFYFPSDSQTPVLKLLEKMGMGDHQLPVKKSQSDRFLTVVLPALQKTGNVQVADEVSKDIIQEPLHARLYLDMSDGFVVGKLLYQYGPYEIDALSDASDSDRLIIRDATKEEQIMQLIEYADFHYNGKELYIEAGNEEQLYDFLYYILPVLEEHVDLYLTGNIRELIMDHQPNPSTSIEVESSSNLLDIGFNLDGIDEEEIGHVLDAVIEKKRYYRLNSGELMSLEGENFSSIQQFIDEMDVTKDDVTDGRIKMPVYRGQQVDELLNTPKDYDPTFRKLLHQLKEPEKQVFPIPDNLHATLRHYQETGFQWFKSLSQYHLGGILADDMGLGKTLQSIAYLLSEEPGSEPDLVVAPSSVLYNWKNEFDKFAPDMRVAIMTGPPQERAEMIESLRDRDVWITSYATLRQDIELYREIGFRTLLLDEAQFIKNYRTKTSKAIREVKSARCFALSGTPIENSIDELWALFQVIMPGLMPDQKTFRKMSHEKIASLTKPFVMRRLKEDVLKELPDKIESVSVSELTGEQKELYLGYLRQVQQEATDGIRESGFQQNRMKILAGLTRLRQICCHPSMFIENYTGTSGKLMQLLETVENGLANGKRMLIFSQFTSMHEIIMQKLEEAGIDYFYLHGQTKSKERVEMSERFNHGEKSIFLISLKAGGTGLNLTGADTVILYDLWWNPAVEDQAAGRAHRFGQKEVVQVIRMITEGTIEEKIYDLQQKKRELIDQVVQPGETMLSSLSEEDVRELLSI